MIEYLNEIEAIHRQVSMESRSSCRSPIVVHCSAGVGRTGVVILTEIMKASLEYNEVS